MVEDMTKIFLFAFDFEEKTMNEYIIGFLKEHQIDWFYQMPGIIVADIFGTDEYYQLDIEINDRKEVYYFPEKKYHRSGLKRLYPLNPKAAIYMRKVIFKIDDIAWMKKHFNLTEEQTEDIFSDQKPFRVLYTLIGKGKIVDRYELTDYDGNKIKMDNLNGYERGVVLNDCYAYFTGGKYHSDTKEPCGVIEIIEETVER